MRILGKHPDETLISLGLSLKMDMFHLENHKKRHLSLFDVDLDREWTLLFASFGIGEVMEGNKKTTEGNAEEEDAADAKAVQDMMSLDRKWPATTIQVEKTEIEDPVF